MESTQKAPITFPHISYTSISKDVQHPVAGRVTGNIPKWLCGSFFRLGPGKFEVGKQQFDHWFDGFAVIHRYKIKQGAVTYDHKLIQSEGYKSAQRCGQLTNVGFGTVTYPDPCKSLFHRFMSYFEIPATDNCNVNLMVLGKDMFALTESYTIQKINERTLDTEESIDIRKYVPLIAQTAHPHTASDGTVYNMGTSVDYRIRYNIIQIPPKTIKESGVGDLNGASVLSRITCPGIHPSYFHSFGITSNFIVFVEQPLTINAFRALTFRLLGNPMDSCLDWNPAKRTYFHLIRRDTGEHLKTRYSAKAFFTLHHINAFEQDGHVVVDMCCYENVDVLNFFKIKNMKAGFIPETDNKPMRFVLPIMEAENIGTSTEQLVTLAGSDARAYLTSFDHVYVEPEMISDVSVEVPQINYASYNGKPYRYFYGLGYGLQTLLKVDISTKTSTSWREVDWFPSEPIFVESPNAQQEDEGVILSSVIHLKGEQPPFLLILDANTFTEVARAEIPADVVYGMHGLFVPDCV
ncbi:carotenoid-cleaving dioxygenase, mitochondrial-like [Antedon mediterranea]|uniref:carotenoid-cleaving dioxygenase, mitochondrial-like n=1 Tax=Antedon mediterranea TaxID=105859 RepID=UPI003AF7677C